MLGACKSTLFLLQEYCSRSRPSSFFLCFSTENCGTSHLDTWLPRHYTPGPLPPVSVPVTPTIPTTPTAATTSPTATTSTITIAITIVPPKVMMERRVDRAKMWRMERMAGWWGWTLRVMHDRWSTTAHHIVVGPLIATTTSCTAAPTLVPKFDKLVSYTGLHFLTKGRGVMRNIKDGNTFWKNVWYQVSTAQN